MWCGACLSVQANFLDREDAYGRNMFQDWAARRGLALVAADVPNYREPGSPQTTPCLLSRDPFLTRLPGDDAPVYRSGAAWMASRGVGDADAAEALARLEDLVRNAARLSSDANPYRCTLPSFALLSPDGELLGRYDDFAFDPPGPEDSFQALVEPLDRMVDEAQRS
jgi:hypothetical protein